MNIRFSVFKRVRNSRPEGLFDGILLGSEDGVLLSSLVVSLVEDSVGFY